MAEDTDQAKTDGAAEAKAGEFVPRPAVTLEGAGAVPRAGDFRTHTLNLGSQPVSPEPSASTSPTTIAGAGSGFATAFGGTRGASSPAAIPINQTVYSIETVTIQNSITINLGDPDVQELKDTIRQLVAAIEGSNEASAEVLRQLRAEITAGDALLQASKVERNAIQLYLINPLRWIAEKFASAIVADLAKHGLELLLKLWSTGV